LKAASWEDVKGMLASIEYHLLGFIQEGIRFAHRFWVPKLHSPVSAMFDVFWTQVRRCRRADDSTSCRNMPASLVANPEYITQEFLPFISPSAHFLSACSYTRV